MAKNYIKPTKKTARKTYNRPSMKSAPAVTPHQLPRDWDGSADGAKSASYLTRVDQVHLQEKHENMRRKLPAV